MIQALRSETIYLSDKTQNIYQIETYYGLTKNEYSLWCHSNKMEKIGEFDSLEKAETKMRIYDNEQK